MATAIAVGSIAFTLIKVALEDLSPLSLAAGRVVFSAAAYVAVVALQPWRIRRVERRDILPLVACGLGGSAGYHLLFTWGQGRVPVAVSAVVLATMPVMVAVGEVLFLAHRLSPLRWFGLALGLAGVGVMSWGQGGVSGHLSVPGLLAVCAATAVWAAVTVMTRSLADRYDPWWLNTPGTLLGVVLTLALAGTGLDEYRSVGLSTWLVVLWLGAVSSAFMYAALARAMKDFSATRTATLGTLVTPLSVLVAWLWLAEVPAPLTLVGGAMAILGVLLVTPPDRARPVTPPQP